MAVAPAPSRLSLVLLQILLSSALLTNQGGISRGGQRVAQFIGDGRGEVKYHGGASGEREVKRGDHGIYGLSEVTETAEVDLISHNINKIKIKYQ